MAWELDTHDLDAMVAACHSDLGSYEAGATWEEIARDVLGPDASDWLVAEVADEAQATWDVT